MSYQSAIHCRLRLATPHNIQVTTMNRSYKHVNTAAICEDVHCCYSHGICLTILSILLTCTMNPFEQLSLTTRTVTVRSYTQWYNDSMRSDKCVRRKLERRRRTTELPSVPDCHVIHTPAKLGHHMSQTADAYGDRKKLLKMLAKLLHTDSDTPVPPCDSFNTFVEHFQLFLGTNVGNPVHTYSKCYDIDIYTDGEPQTCLLNVCPH